jgi:hypothetical protein
MPPAFQCACLSGNGHACAELRYGYRDQPEPCECECHSWPDDYEDDLSECPRCHGDGGDPWNDYVLPCPECNGGA